MSKTIDEVIEDLNRDITGMELELVNDKVLSADDNFEHNPIKGKRRAEIFVEPK
jgi:hypothetical protein